MPGDGVELVAFSGGRFHVSDEQQNEAHARATIARVGQGIVSAIGSSNSYKDVLENPDFISRKVLDSGLDSQTAFEIVSIDIADISVAGTGAKDVANVGAMLETERAEADKKMRQAEAEGRRAMAVAREQEMRAMVQEMQAKVVEAQAEVPKAMAQALREGWAGPGAVPASARHLSRRSGFAEQPGSTRARQRAGNRAR